MKFMSFFNDISIRNKLVFFFIIISLVPTLVIGTISYKISEGIIKDKEVNKVIRNLRDTDTAVFNYLGEKRNIAIRLSMNDNVISLMKDSDENKKVKDEFEVGKLLNDYRNKEGIQSIYLLDNKGKEYTNDINKTDSYERIIFQKWYSEILSEKIYMWGDVRELNSVYTLPFYRISIDLATGKPVGLVLLNIREDYIYRLFENMVETQGEIIVLNQNDRVVSTGDKMLLGRELHDVYGADLQFPGPQGYFVKKLNNQEYLVTYTKNDILNWTYICMERLGYILTASEKIKGITISLCVLCLLVTFLFSLFLSARFAKPVSKLLNNIQLVQQGNLENEMNFKSRDEFGQIGSAFDDMLKKLRRSIADIYNAQQKKREAEIKALLMQINPHFLYNTLTSIIWMTNNGKKNEVINMVSSLSKLFRISISRGKEIITVGEELEHAESYLAIQKIRYRDEFNCIFEVPDGIRRLYTPKLLLQPLVENSIYHGIKNNDNNGLIIIKAYLESKHLVFEVIDNGKSMTDEEIDSLNNFLMYGRQDSDFGIGIKNVNDRIKLFFGPDYGLSYRKTNGMTAASIVIPVLEEDKQEF